MTREDQLSKIRSACIAANSDLIPNAKHLATDEGLSRPVRLSDVLLASETQWATMYAADGGLIDGKPSLEVLPEGLRLYQIVRKWNLRKDDLTEQSDPTISFICGLLD